MTQFRTFTADDAIRSAETAMAKAAGHPIRIDAATDLGDAERRNIILRGHATGPAGTSRPIIIKATRAIGYDPSAPNAWQTSGLIREFAATSLLGPDTAPALLAADLQNGVLVYASLGADLNTLVHPLLHGSPTEAEYALSAYATALGRLHARTAGRSAEYAALVHAALPDAEIPPPARAWVERIARKAPALLGGTVPEDELALFEHHLQAPGPWLSLLHNDPCPDNVLITPDGEVRLIDFEFASFGHALSDAAYWWMGFPTCWCAGTVPRSVAHRLDAAYRAAALPDGDDAGFRRESAIIAAAWLLGSLGWLLEPALQDNEAWGIASRRSRIIHYLDMTISRTQDAGVLPGIRAVALSWRRQLAERWPDIAPLALYPAFTASTSGRPYTT